MPDQHAGHPRNEQAFGQRFGRGLLPVFDFVPGALEQFEVRLNGLITNDKFCFIRTAQLKLTWSRFPLRLRSRSTGRAEGQPENKGHQGGLFG